MFVKTELCETYNVSVLDDSSEGTKVISWLKLKTFALKILWYVCVICMPPSESTRLNDPELFYSTLLEQVYSYQNDGCIYICGDFNSRFGDASEFIEGVDDVTPRDVIYRTSNVNGDLFIEF